MNVKQLLSVGAGLLVVSSTLACGSTIKTATDYDPGISFSKYRSFSLLKGNPSGSPLMDQRVQADVVNALAAKGWTEDPSGHGQATVVVHAATKTKHTYETMYDGMGGGWGWRRGWGGGFGGYGNATTFVNDYKVGTLVVDIFDAATKEAIWHGFASDALSNNATSNAQTTEQAVDKMFSSFPPTTAASAR
jgi:hypothetical protein